VSIRVSSMSGNVVIYDQTKGTVAMVCELCSSCVSTGWVGSVRRRPREAHWA